MTMPEPSANDATHAPVDARAATAAALLALPGLHAARLRTLFDTFGSVEAVGAAVVDGSAALAIPPTGRTDAELLGRTWQREWDPEGAARLLVQHRARVVIEGDDDDPILDHVADRPPILLLQGTATIAARPRVAIVGTRSATPPGLADAFALAATLAQSGVIVISGLAIGIDTAAHEGALAGDDMTVGVIATGPDVVYPRRNRLLYERIRARGLLVSETWFGATPEAWRFPVRNRIISALSDAVVVVEATERGGARITAEHALAHGRAVFAMPGSRRSPAAAGCNQLIADGAFPLLDPSDVLLCLGLDATACGWTPIISGAASTTATADDAVARQVLAALHGEAASVDDLAAQLQLGAGEVASAVSRLVRARQATRARGLVWAL